MTNREAAKIIISNLYQELTGQILIPARVADDFIEAACLAICALMREEEGKRCKCEGKEEA